MSFGGSVLAMIQSLRANARPKHKAFQHWEKQEENTLLQHQKLTYKTVSADVLGKIKAKNKIEIEWEQRRSSIKIGLITLLFVPLIAFFIFNFFFQTTQETQALPTNKTKTESIENEQVNYLLNSGFEWLNKNHYKNARFQFNRALQANPEDEYAMYGITASYVYECITDNQNCDEAEKRLAEFRNKFGSNASFEYLTGIFENKILPGN